MNYFNLGKQTGVSLIEILITTLILGIGLLGVAALQVSSLSSNQEGFFTSQATSIAEDVASRIRSAKVVTMVPRINEADIVDHLTYINNYVSAGPFSCADVKLCRNDGAAAVESCTLAELAAFDKEEICEIANTTLPQGLVRVSAVGSRLSIVVDWNSASGRSDIGNLQNINSHCAALTLNANRNCVIMEILP